MTGRIDTKLRSRLWLATALATTAAVALTVSVAYADLGQTRITSTPKVYEYNPAANDAYIAWERTKPGHRKHYDLYARPFVGPAFKVNADGTNGGGGGIDGTTLVYSQWKAGRPGNLHLMDLVTRIRTKLPAVVNTRGDEYWPSISGDWIQFQRKTHRFRREYIYNTSTHELRQLDEVPATGYMESGQVTGNYVTWMKCGRVTCKVRLYDIAAQTRTVLPVASVRPRRHRRRHALLRRGKPARAVRARGATDEAAAWRTGDDAGLLQPRHRLLPDLRLHQRRRNRRLLRQVPLRHRRSRPISRHQSVTRELHAEHLRELRHG